MPTSNGRNGSDRKGKNGRSSQKRDRRDFLKTAAAGAGALALPGSGTETTTKAKSRRESASKSAAIEYPRVFRDSQLAMIAFPLGGVGAGSLSLGGRGQLREWWIFNRPDLGRSPDYAFPSVWVQSGNHKPAARILEARIQPPYEGQSGLGSANLPGLPRLESCTFTGEFPFARIDFHDSVIPVRISLEAFSPFLPHDADDSGLPVAVLRYRVTNPTATKAKVSIAFSIDNPVGEGNGASSRANEYREGEGVKGIVMTNPFLAGKDPLAGSFVLSVMGEGKLSYWRGWPRDRWWQPALDFWDRFSRDGDLGPEAAQRGTVGSLCLGHEIPAGGKAEYTFLLSWHFPNRTPKRCGWDAPKGYEGDVIGNYYSTRFHDAWEAAQYAAGHLPGLESRTRQFAAAIRDTTVPAAAKDAATANLSALVAPTSFRTADGHFHGFEGCNEHAGCCFGSCTHVWNYEAAVANLFPALSRSLRERQFGFSTDEQGRMDFRELLPFGLEHWGFAAADGQMGTLIKLYYDWRQSGDTEWLRKLWPTAKRALEFAWTSGGWDANKDGVMEGVQHNTYDVEFIGPNPLCGIWYLGALRAGEEMARAVGDNAAATEYRRLFESGSKWIDDNLFNGEYYIQKIGTIPAGQVAKGLIVGMGGDTEHPTFQLGDGCLLDQLLGQQIAGLAGLGLLLDRGHVERTLRSILKYNYKSNLAEHETVQRTYALNDEAGLVVCAYAPGKRPPVPFPYFGEVWTGEEYSTAALMIEMGMTKEGVEVVENVRRRYDGERRNPWNEPECGYYYARPMASWSPFLTLSGFRYHGGEKDATFLPPGDPQHFSSFWSTGTAWGMFAREPIASGVRLTLTVSHGNLACRSVTLAASKGAGRVSSAKLGDRAVKHEVRLEENRARFTFAEELALREGDKLILTV